MTLPIKQDSASAPGDALHVPALDGLRALAILLVIPHNSDNFTNSSGFLFPIAALAHAGWIGVQLFFVLSGFLITRNLLHTRNCTNYLGAFYGRRMLRIFPLYFLALFVGLFLLPKIVALSAETLASQSNQFWLWVFLSNWVQPFNKGVIGFSHFWSLAVEEQFYLVWPFVVMAATVTRLRWISMGLICIAITVRYLCVRAGLVPEIPYQFTVCRMDALAVGAIAAGFVASNQWSAWLSTRRNFALFVACSILLGTALSSHLFNAFEDTTLIIGQTTLAIGFGLVLLIAVETWRAGQRWWLSELLQLRLLRSVGKYSYAMYVVHLPIALGLGSLLKDWLATDDRLNPILFSAMVVVASYVSGWLSYHCFEKHFLKLKPSYKIAAPLHA
jgi:peptidoglycan/LPS O-acetylase OafA/YrhL